ncbi:MAG: Hsp20/alpha crystallin family protein [Patescibacteria group bacterium]
MSNLAKWSPFFEPFEEFDDFFKSVPMVSAKKGGLIPPIDMYDTKDSVIIETPLAGVDPKKISIEVENGVLTIKGSCERKTEVDDKNYYRKEIRAGQIFRQVNLPSRVEDDKAEAEYKDGMLKVTIPKSPEAKPKTIKIDVKKTNE